ncbi:GIY-YIG nuclease family protein [Herbiconiux moechotypicola]|uniref:GIY-YIG domain-containing protein n=1 Tax=Herbiconiux moechotypicola TaxID=637393 RepID=A0ABN3E8X8_9MICO|nr:GIY-YIG nuclease family protein [Herbiconiux moechotypicola]MCS5732108.1 GIY-YIG nuclease family protein [Herbiconiux moechotypicola]
MLILNYEGPERPRRRWAKAFTLAPDEEPVEHFGEVRLPGKYGHRLMRERYALADKKLTVHLPRDWSPSLWDAMDSWFEDEDHRIYTDAHCAELREEALVNFDLNMAFFAQIPQASFDEAVSTMLKRKKQLRPIMDLKELDGREGLYVMVLDDYRQTYIGQSSDMRRRIKNHWAGTKKLDRLVFGPVHESVMSIDAFRALDTTRIFAAVTSRADALEACVVRTFPADYRLNRIGGGILTKMRALFIKNEMNRRQLSSQAAVMLENVDT